MESIERFVIEQLAAWEVPGCAIAAVRDGDVVLAAGWGQRDLRTELPAQSSASWHSRWGYSYRRRDSPPADEARRAKFEPHPAWNLKTLERAASAAAQLVTRSVGGSAGATGHKKESVMGLGKKAKHEAKAVKHKTKKDAGKAKHKGKKVKNAAKH